VTQAARRAVEQRCGEREGDLEAAHRPVRRVIAVAASRDIGNEARLAAGFGTEGSTGIAVLAQVRGQEPPWPRNRPTLAEKQSHPRRETEPPPPAKGAAVADE
jgi:hypothetical protein